MRVTKKDMGSAAGAAPRMAGRTPSAALRALYESATAGPWAIESCGEKGDGSNMIGVVFGPDDPECKRPIAGWLPEWNGEGDEPQDFYRDEEVCELPHSNRNSNRDAPFIAAAYNNFPMLLDALDACAGMLGLTQLLLGRDDLPAGVRDALTTNHRVEAARAVITKAEGRASIPPSPKGEHPSPTRAEMVEALRGMVDWVLSLPPSVKISRFDSRAGMAAFNKARAILTKADSETHEREAANGRPIPEDLCVLHRCDTPACINPNHLFLGTRGENNKDKFDKGRMCRGIDHGATKLTDAEVRAIRADGRPHGVIAAEYGVSLTHVSALRLFQRRVHLSSKEIV